MKKIKKELNGKILGYVLAGLGLVAGLAWNDAIKSLIEHLFPLQQNTVWAKVVYALLITIFVVFLSFYLTKIFKKEKEEKAEKE